MKEHVATTKPLTGAMTALVTPFRNGQVDWNCLKILVDRQIQGGTDWLVPLGTTGESPTLSNEERDRILALVIEESAGRCPVLAGTGSNDTARTVDNTQRAVHLGAAAVMVVAPCYNRPTAEGLYQHFAAVASAVQVPIVLYDVPARTGIRIDHEVIVRLHDKFPHIVGVKDATGGITHVAALNGRCNVSVLCGDDSLAWPFLAVGAVGVISVVANLVPALIKTLVVAAERQDMGAAMRAHRKIFDLATTLGQLGPNPIPIKTAMSICGLIREEFRLPLCPVGKADRQIVEQLLRRHELLDPVPA